MTSAMGESSGNVEEEEIPIKLQLGGTALTMNATGQWDLEHSAYQEVVENSNALKKKVEQLEKENRMLQEKCAKMTEESNMEKFKCQLLVEMLAITTLDEEKSRAEVEQERAKASSLRNDLLVLMEQARKEGIEIKNLSDALEVHDRQNMRNPALVE